MPTKNIISYNESLLGQLAKQDGNNWIENMI